MSAPVKFSIITNYLSAILVLLVTLYLSSQSELWEETGVQCWLGALVRPLKRNFFSDTKCFFFLSGQLEFSQFKLKDVIHRKTTKNIILLFESIVFNKEKFGGGGGGAGRLWRQLRLPELLRLSSSISIAAFLLNFEIV